MNRDFTKSNNQDSQNPAPNTQTQGTTQFAGESGIGEQTPFGGQTQFDGRTQFNGRTQAPGQGIYFSQNSFPGQNTLPVKDSFYKRHKGLVVFGIILFCIILLTVLLVSCTASLVKGGNEEQTVQDISSPYIAVVSVEGTISESTETDYLGNSTGYQHTWILAQIDELMDDSNNKGIMLYINSPGGGVYESAELYNKLKEYKAETNRPVYSYMAQYAASGGYYITSGADKIIANENTMTGSIGVYMGPVLDLSVLLDKLGVDVTIIRSGANKAMGNSYEPLTDEQKAIYQSIVDEYYGNFISVISEGRGMDESIVRSLADGRTYTAKQALSNGLIDGISSFEDAKDTMLSDMELEDTEFFPIEYVNTYSVFDLLFSSLGELTDAVSSVNKTELEEAIELAETYNDIEISYMMTVK